MNLFFTIARVVRTGYKALRAAAGIMIVVHAMSVWVRKRVDERRQRAVAA